MLQFSVGFYYLFLGIGSCQGREAFIKACQICEKSVYIPFNIEPTDFQHGTFEMLLGVQLLDDMFLLGLVSLAKVGPAGTKL